MLQRVIGATLCFGRAVGNGPRRGPPDKTEHFLNATLSLRCGMGEEGGTVTNAGSHAPKDAVVRVRESKWVIVSMMRPPRRGH